MKTVTFRVIKHATLPVDVCEILVDGNVAATVYPRDSGFELVSAHFAHVGMIDGPRSGFPPIPSIQVQLDPQPYSIEGGKIVKLTRQ